MTLDQLTTPYERRRVIEYGRNGNKVVRHWYEVQQVFGPLYKTREEPDEWGIPHCDLVLFYNSISDGLKEERWIHPDHWELDRIVNGEIFHKPQTIQEYMADLDASMEAGRFIGNAIIEFVRQFDANRAMRYAKHRADHIAHMEERDRQKAQARRDAEATEKAEKEAALAAEKGKYLGWADTITAMRFGKAKAKLEKRARFDGVVMTYREFVISTIKKGWLPIKVEGMTTRIKRENWEYRSSKPKTEYRLVHPTENLCYTVSKTEFDFAAYLCEHMEALDETKGE